MDLHWIVLCYLVVVRRMGGIIVEGVCSVLLICIMTRGGRKEGRKEGRWGGGFIYFVFVVYVGVFPRRKVVDCNFLWVVVSRYGIVLGLGI